ncbi:glycosyltransferase family 4 protein [Deinococcus wulumuqiensis]
MKITFILPGAGFKPVGGFKVVYEYANGLVRAGHEVSIVHGAIFDIKDKGIKKYLRKFRYIQRLLDKSYIPKWFKIDKRVKMIWSINLDNIFIPDGDFVFATSWHTAEWVNKYSKSKGKKYYLIQHYENWHNQEDRLIATWRMPLKKIVIAEWLKKVAVSLGEEAVIIPNGLDFSKFDLYLPQRNRNPMSVLIMYHIQDWKGFKDGVEALKIIRDKGFSVNVTAFGAYKPDRYFPDWIDYFYLPDEHVLNQLYNSSSIFIAPSWTEGWGLPASEAMYCGCVLIATNIGGHQEFMSDNVNALLSAPSDSTGLANNIIKVFEDGQLRERLSYEGHKSIKKFTWERSIGLLIKELEKDYG